MNTTPEIYDDVQEEKQGLAAMEPEEILMCEDELLAGLLELENDRNDQENYRKIQIRRKGVLKLEFRVRPISENESMQCMKQANKYAPTKAGQPKVILERDPAYYRSSLIYTATVDEDRAKVWDNQKALNAMGLFNSIEMIDRVLKAGEKDRVIDIIDEISGFNDLEDYAGNSLTQEAKQG